MECAGRFGWKKGGRVSSYFVLSLLSLFLPFLYRLTSFLLGKSLPSLPFITVWKSVAHHCSPFSPLQFCSRVIISPSGEYIRRYIRDFTFSSDLFLSTGKKLEINSYDKYYKGKDRCRCVYPCWYPFNTPLRITFAKFIHPEEKEKDRESRSRPDKQLSRMIHYDPSREENEENEEEEEKVEGPLKISKSSKLSTNKSSKRDMEITRAQYRNWTRIFSTSSSFYFTRRLFFSSRLSVHSIKK